MVVSATLLGTQDPRQALESVSEEGPYTFLEILGHCVALPVSNYCSLRSNHFATTCKKKRLLETLFDCAQGPCLHVETHLVRTAATLRTTAFASVDRRCR